MRTIGVVTVGRSDYGIYRPVLRRLAERSEIEIALYVGEAHVLERFGRTVDEIVADGYPVASYVRYGAADEDAGAPARAAGAFADAFSSRRPDLLLVVGDRVEMLAAGVAALPLTIPVAHLHGGESSEGAVDESARHALTKLSHLHFAATEVAGRRIVQMGEEPWRVVVSGAPALDAIAEHSALSDAELAARGVRLRGETLLATYHPVTLHPGQTLSGLAHLLAAIEATGLDAVFTYPNADAGHGEIIDAVERFAAGSDRFTVVRNLGTAAYYSLMSRAVAMIGNSSSGIVEAASFGLPVVDVGDRQRGRLRAANVVHAEPEADAIVDAVATAVSGDFRSGLVGLVNPYGDGHASERIVERLAAIPLDERLLVKRFHELAPDAVVA